MRDHKKRNWIPEPASPLCGVNGETRAPGATSPLPLRRDRHHLTATMAGKLLRAEELLELDVAADETRQATPGSGLEASPRGAGARHLVDLYRIGEPPYRHGAEGLDGDVAFGQSESVSRREHGTRLCHLFHATGQMRRLAHDGVVHEEIVADRTTTISPELSPTRISTRTPCDR